MEEYRRKGRSAVKREKYNVTSETNKKKNRKWIITIDDTLGITWQWS